MRRPLWVLLVVISVIALGFLGTPPRAWADGAELACCVCSGGTCGDATVCVQIIEVGVGSESCVHVCDERCGLCDTTSPDVSCDHVGVVDYQSGVSCLQLAECRIPSPAPAMRWPALTVSALALAALAFRLINRRRRHLTLAR